MRRTPRTTPRRRGHALRVRVVAAVVLAGYLSALGATSAGHGFRLAAHLFSEHRQTSAPAAPIHRPHGPDAEHEGGLPVRHDEAHRRVAHGHDEAHGHTEPHGHAAEHEHVADQGHTGAHGQAEHREYDRQHSHDAGPGHAGSHRRHDARDAEHDHHGHVETPVHAAEHAAGHPGAGAHDGPEGGADPHGVHEHGGRLHSHQEEPPPPPLLTVALDKHCFLPGCPVPSPLPARGLDSVSPGAAYAPVVLPVERKPPRRTA